MRTSIIAIVLGLSAAAATAQCVAQSPAAPAAAIAAPTSPAPSRGELITTAAAGTRNDASMLHEATAHDKAAATLHGNDKHDRRTGGAMLFAALALMSGIALRRLGATRQ
jgi:hypothetical protein